MKKILEKLASWICLQAGLVAYDPAVLADEEKKHLEFENKRLFEENKQLTNDLEDSNAELLDYRNRFEKAADQRKALQLSCRRLLQAHKNSEALADEDIYDMLISAFDADGRMLYATAKKILGAKEAYHYFPIEDTLGYFEEGNGFSDLRWLEIHYFGKRTYREIQPNVEIIDGVSFEERQNDLDSFHEKLYGATLEKILDVPANVAN